MAHIEIATEIAALAPSTAELALIHQLALKWTLMRNPAQLGSLEMLLEFATIVHTIVIVVERLINVLSALKDITLT